MSEGLVDQGGDGDRFKANLEVPSVARRHLGGENLGTVPEIKLHNIDDLMQLRRPKNVLKDHL